MKKHHLILAALLCLLPFLGRAAELRSPNGHYVVSIDDLHYTIQFHGQVIVQRSRLGVDIDNRLFESALAVPRGPHEDWSGQLVLAGVDSVVCHDETWTPLYGENATVRNHYNEFVLHYEKGNAGRNGSTGTYDKRRYYAMDIIVRAYDEGIAFRYHFPETTNCLFLHVTGERTEFALPEGTMAWYEEWAQGPYEKRPLLTSHASAADGAGWYESERPLLTQLPGGTYVALLEAGMKDYVRGKFRLVRDHVLQVALYDCADLITPYDTPWRVVMAARRAVDLVNHKDIMLNLNDPCQDKDMAWVKPGKAFRCCKLNRQAILSSIDFCARQGIEYVELDAGWYGPEGKVSSDARRVLPSRDFTMPEICRYARQKGVGVWLYVNQRALYRQLDELLPLYEEWGIAGIKFGFVHIGNQQWSTWLHHAVEQCARHHLMVDIHDEYRPTGLSRTYPNLLTQEGVRGNEEMPDARHNALLPFTRYLCGPADYTPCYFSPKVKNTKGHQLAMAAVYYSPLQFLFWYDDPFEGEGEAELQFWRDCPTVFDQSLALDGLPGEYIVQARRSGRDWFVGALNGTEKREVSIPTDFLPKGKYQVTLYNDDPSLQTRTQVSRHTWTQKAGKPVTLTLQASGGAALHFQPL